MTERWAVVTRYRRPEGRVVRHVYLDPDGNFFTTRARAMTEVRRIVREGGEVHGHALTARALDSGDLEVVPVKVVQTRT